MINMDQNNILYIIRGSLEDHRYIKILTREIPLQLNLCSGIRRSSGGSICKSSTHHQHVFGLEILSPFEWKTANFRVESAMTCGPSLIGQILLRSSEYLYLKNTCETQKFHFRLLASRS
jgi:hypothetical protein